MANEITALEQRGDDRTISALFLFPIATPIQVGGANVVPTPSAGLPAVAVLTAQEKLDLDAGTLAWRVVEFQRQNLTDPQMLTMARALYAAERAAFDAEYALRYEYAGRRFNAV